MRRNQRTLTSPAFTLASAAAKGTDIFATVLHQYQCIRIGCAKGDDNHPAVVRRRWPLPPCLRCGWLAFVYFAVLGVVE